MTPLRTELQDEERQGGKLSRVDEPKGGQEVEEGRQRGERQQTKEREEEGCYQKTQENLVDTWWIKPGRQDTRGYIFLFCLPNDHNPRARVKIHLLKPS